MALIDAVQNVVAFRRASAYDINLISLANQLQIDSSALPNLGPAKQRFLDDTAAVDSAASNNLTPPLADQEKAVDAYLRFVSNVFSETVNAQDAAIGAGKTKVLFLESLPIDIQFLGTVIKEARANPGNALGVAAFDRLKGYATRNKANRAKVADLLKARGEAAAAAAVVNPPAAEVVNPPAVIDNATGGSSKSDSGSMLPKVLLAVAAVGVVYFFMRRRRA